MSDSRLMEVNSIAYRGYIGSFITQFPLVHVMAIVKANAYGLGSLYMAKQALLAGAHFLGVATCQEALELLMNGIRAPILILSESPDPIPQQLFYHNIHFCAYTEGYLLKLATTSNPLLSNRISIHLKVNTGMNRLGVTLQDLPHWLDTLHQHKNRLHLRGLMTHFASADVPDHPFTQAQLTCFQKALRSVKQCCPDDDLLVHACNSDAAKTIPDAHFDMVRLGLGAYRDIVTLKTKVSFMQPILKGESVGYGCDYTASSDTWIATAPFGYADGIPRSYSKHGGQVIIHDHYYPVAGRVCMDMMMIDLGQSPSSIDIGTPITLIGGKPGQAHIPLLQAAQWADRSEYEILCGIGARVHRKYIYR